MITSNKSWNTVSYKHTLKLTDRNPPITNHKRWPFEPIEVNLCFLRGLLRWLTAATNANVSWLLNFRICAFMKSTVNWEYACILPATIFFTYLLPSSLTVHVSVWIWLCVPFYPSHNCFLLLWELLPLLFLFCFFLCAGAGYSLALSLCHHDIVKGTCLDYMHGLLLLGVVKTLLSLWFFPSKYNKGADYLIGDKVTL